MTANGVIQLALFMGVLIALAKPLGAYMARVYEGRPLFGLDRLLGPVERLTYRACGVRADREQGWKCPVVADRRRDPVAIRQPRIRSRLLP